MSQESPEGGPTSQPHKTTRVKHPAYRRLRAFAFDPIMSRQIETYDVNEVTISIPWDDGLEMGPVDSYIEVVDHDPASLAYYAPVDLNNPAILAEDGLTPSEGNPQFHQQMVYAVIRTTIDHFEKALGRKTLWSPRRRRTGEDLNEEEEEFVQRLRVYPHGIRDDNAYYSPVKKALFFGYFPASFKEYGQNMPGEIVFTCLSHDIVAHETTHAILDGLHPMFMEPSNRDNLALHEAVADIVALFQHFTYPQVLKHQIALTQGELERQSLLGQLAVQFGQATEQYGALRSAIGKIDPVTKEWVPVRPNPMDIGKIFEVHERGAILVAAVFDAFMTIYRSRVRDLLRIATGGTGILPKGDIHPDLVDRLASEASKTAGHILNMCIRALDYCPPVDIDFGDYLRALITADYDLVSDDPHNYRLAVIEAFRGRGIYPADVKNLSVESLLWHAPREENQERFAEIQKLSDLHMLLSSWGTGSDRKIIFERSQEAKKIVQQWFKNPLAIETLKSAHITLEKGAGSLYVDKDGVPSLEIHSIRPARRIGPDGQTVAELVVEMTQSRRGYSDKNTQDNVDSNKIDPPEPDFIMRGGCTLLVDPDTERVRYCIYKDVMNDNRLGRMREFIKAGGGSSLFSTYFGDPRREYFIQLIGRAKERKPEIEPFALLHRAIEMDEEM